MWALEAYAVVCGGANALLVAVGDDVVETEVAVVDDGVHLLLATHILDLSAAEVVGFRQLQRLGIMMPSNFSISCKMMF